MEIFKRLIGNQGEIMTVDMNDWIASGGGAVGTSFFHKTDSTLLLKMLPEDADPSIICEELDASRKAYAVGVDCPVPGKLVTDGARIGMIMQRIEGKVSYARAVGENPEKIDELAAGYAAMVKKLHSTPCTDPSVPSAKEFSRSHLDKSTFHPKALLDKARALLEVLPDGDTCLHGDLHFGNIIKVGDKSWFIDLGNFNKGCPLFDLGMMDALLILADAGEYNYEHDYHCTPAQGHEFNDKALKAYFGQDADLVEIHGFLMPFVIFRMLTMETQISRALPPKTLGFVDRYLENMDVDAIGRDIAARWPSVIEG